MFIGHFALGFAAKKIEPKVSLGTYFIAFQFADLLWPTLLLLGVEKVEISPGITAVTPLDFVSYPISHSLLMISIWGLLFGTTYYVARRNSKAAWLLGLGVVSHWVLDLIMHRPDLPLLPGNDLVFGLGLWNSVLWSQVLEVSLFTLCVWIYLNNTKALNKKGSIGLWSLVIFFLIIQASNILGPPPPNVMAIAWAGQLQWLFVIWAYWIDRNRETINSY